MDSIIASATEVCRGEKRKFLPTAVLLFEVMTIQPVDRDYNGIYISKSDATAHVMDTILPKIANWESYSLTIGSMCPRNR